MISLAPTRARIAALLTTALAATTVAVTAPAARAEATDPVLTAISLQGPHTVVAGQPVTFAYAATDDGTTLKTVQVLYTDSLNRTSYWSLGSDLPLSGEQSTTVQQGLPNEALRAASVSVFDSDGTRTSFRRDGVVCRVNACTPRAHTLDLASLDVLVSGSTPDKTIPLVTAVTTSTPTVAVGDTVHLDVVLDEANPATPMLGTSWGATLRRAGTTYEFRLRPTSAGYTHLAGLVPATVPNGTYSVDVVSVPDAVGNVGSFHSAGYVSRFPSSAAGPASHALDLDGVTVTVSGSTVDVEAPAFTGLTYPKGTLTKGAPTTLGFAASDDLSGVASLDLTYYPSFGGQEPSGGWTLHATVTGDGVASGSVPAVDTGKWWLQRVTVTDKAGNYATYAADGTAWCSTLCAKTHTLDFAQWKASVVTVPDQPSWGRAVPGNGTARVEWNPPSDNGDSPLTGFTVAVSPGGKVYTAAATARALQISGLANNTSYSFAVRAKNAVGAGRALPVKAMPRAPQRIFIARDFSYDGRADLVAVTRSNTAYVYKGNGSGGISGSGVKVSGSFARYQALMPAVAGPDEDFFVGGMLAVPYAGGDESWWGYNGSKLTAANSLFTSFINYRHVVTPGNFIGSSAADVLAITDAGDLYLWSARSGVSAFYTPRKISSGWQYFTTVIGVGDLDGDRRNDLVARKKDGTLWLYAGNGTGGFRYKKQIGTSTSWKSFAQIAGMGDFTGDKRNDLLALAPNGYLYVYKGNGKGGFTGKALISKGFGSFV